MSTINLVGFSSSDPVPGEYVEVNFAQGDASLSSGIYAALLLANKTSAGSATADTVVYGPTTPTSLGSESDCIALFGAGSEMHRAYRRFIAVNKTTPIYALAVSEGGSSVAATGTVTVSTTATGAGTLRIWVGDEFVDTGFVSGDNVTTIAAAAVVNINARTYWPCTASNVAGVITLLAKQGGLRGNLIRYMAQILPTTSGTTVTPLASTAFTGGSVADSLTTALATILAKNFAYIIPSQADQTNLVALLSQVNTQALATTGIRQRVVAGSVDTVSNAITISTALNGARHELVWLAQSDMTPGELAANNAAVYMLEEAPEVPLMNFSSYGEDAKTSGNWKVKAPLSGAAPTRAQLVSALNAGLTPIGVRSTGRTYLVKRITTRFLNGASLDYRIRDAHKVTVSDRYADALIARSGAQFHGKQIADDPKKNEPEPNPQTVTPRVVKAMVNRTTRNFGEDGMLQRVGEIIAGTVVVRETSPASRMSVQVPLQPSDILDQLAFQVNQVA